MNLSKWIPWAVIAGVIVIVLGWFISAGNQMVTLSEGVSAQWSQVENVYQRRADLIPNLVNTVKGYAKHEADVLEKVTEARSHVGQVQVNADNPQSLQTFEQAQGQLSSALSHLMVVVEKYPDLKANSNFMELQSQLEGTENRIAVERKRFNEAAMAYNVTIRQFPASLVASLRGFQPKPYFQAAAGAQTAPKVDF